MIFVRRGEEDDLDSIGNMVSSAVKLMRAGGNYQWGPDYPTKVHFKADMQAGNCYVAEFTNDVDGASKVCGVIALTEDQGNDYKQLWDISETCIVPHRLCVDPTVRGKGIAKRLMDQAEAVAKERGYSTIRCDTNSQNKHAQNLFAALSYKFVGNLKLTGREALTFMGYEKAIA